MALERGKLVLSKKGKPQVEMNGTRFNLAQGELSQTLITNVKDFNGVEVEFELEGGQPKRIRAAGGEFVPPHHSGISAKRGSRQKNVQGGNDNRNQRARIDHREDARMPDFHWMIMNLVIKLLSSRIDFIQIASVVASVLNWKQVPLFWFPIQVRAIQMMKGIKHLNC